MHGDLALDASRLVAILFLSLRLAVVFMMTPLLAAAVVPPTVRILLIVGLAAALSIGTPVAPFTAPAAGIEPATS